MIVRNNDTKKEYPLSKEKWDALGKHQKIFTIINSQDNHQVAQKVVSNLIGKDKNEVEKNSEIKNVVKTAENVGEEKKKDNKKTFDTKKTDK